MTEFLRNFLTVGAQVAALFVMMAFGFVMSRAKLVTKEGADQMTDVLLWTVTPCLLVETFYNSRSTGIGGSMLVFAALAAAGMLLPLAGTLLLFRKNSDEDRPVLRFGTAFSNCGFMGLPLAQAIYGDTGVMYASVFLTAFLLLQWTVGYAMMSGKGTPIKKILLNPGIIGFVISIPLLFLPFSIPEQVMYPVKAMASMNTPLAMVVIGARLAFADLKTAFGDKKIYSVAALRLAAVPALAILTAVLVPQLLPKTGWLVLIIELAAPTAATSALISAQTGKNSELGGGEVAVTTLLSAVTLPLAAAIGQTLL